MEVPRYLEIKNLCNNDTYAFLREMKASPENFKISQFLEYILAKRDIEYIEHKFSSKNIAGHYFRDELGKSIMINTSNNRQTKNSTGLHEVGHDTLHVNFSVSQCFHDDVTNLYDGTENIEIEANTASMMYYVPGISLYTTASDPIMNFPKMLNLFDVPNWMLERRLIRFLQINCMMPFSEAEATVEAYQGKSYYDRNSLLQEMLKVETFESKIIREFTDPSFFETKTNASSTMETRSLFSI